MNTYKNTSTVSGRIQPIGRHHYDIIIGRKTRSRPAFIVRGLVGMYPDDFSTAGQLFDSCDHQVLLAADDFNIFRLTDPMFDAADSLCQTLECHVSLSRIEAHPIALALHIGRTVTELTKNLNDLDPDTAKALYASLCFGQDAELDEYTVMTAGWWTEAYISTWQTKAFHASNCSRHGPGQIVR